MNEYLLGASVDKQTQVSMYTLNGDFLCMNAI